MPQQISERLALISFYIATGGPNWGDNTNWLSSAPLSDWHGVETNDNGWVTHLILNGNGLKGKVPGRFGADASSLNILPFLEHLELGNNLLSGSIPAELGLFTGLRTLDVSGNRLNGPIPAELSNLTSLETLYLGGGNNSFTECIPSALKNLAAHDLSTLNLPFCGGSAPEPEAVPLPRNPAEDFGGLTGTGVRPEGIWSNGETMWVSWVSSEENGGRIYAYDMETKARVESLDFDSALAQSGNQSPESLWGNNTTLWVGDTVKGRIFAYRLSNQSRMPSAEFDTLGDSDHRSLTPRGLWSDGTTLWEAESGGHKIFAYNLSNRSRDSRKDFNTLGPAGNETPEGIWSDGEVMWVADIRDDKLYAYGLDSKQRLPHLDFNDLGSFGNGHVADIWSDGTTMWVLDNNDRKIYAYHMPSFEEQEDAATDPEPAPVEPAPNPQGHPDDIAALRAFYQATGGPNWRISREWLEEGVPVDEWFGVRTDENTGRVTTLVLIDNNVGDVSGLGRAGQSAATGELPPELGNLAGLRFLNLSEN